MDFLCTQKLGDDFDESFVSDKEERKQVGTLVIEQNEKLNLLLSEHPVFEGENVVGRHEDCDICIPNGAALSKKHACIEANGDSSYLFDCGSSNKTKLGSLRLKPEVRYCLQDGDNIVFANIKCVFQKFIRPVSINSSFDDMSNKNDDVLTPKQVRCAQLLAVDTPEAMQERRPTQHVDVDANVVPDSLPTKESTVELNGTNVNLCPLTATLVNASDCDQTHEEVESLSNEEVTMGGPDVDTGLESSLSRKVQRSCDNNVDGIFRKVPPTEQNSENELALFCSQQGSENVEDTMAALETQSYSYFPSNSQHVSKEPSDNTTSTQSDSDTDIEDEYSMLAKAETQAFSSIAVSMNTERSDNPNPKQGSEKVVDRVCSPEKPSNQMIRMPSRNASKTSLGRVSFDGNKINAQENDSKQIFVGLSDTRPNMAAIAEEKAEDCTATMHEDTLSLLETQDFQGDVESTTMSSEQKMKECTADESDSDTDVDEEYSMLTTTTAHSFPCDSGNMKKSSCDDNETVTIAQKLESLKKLNKSPLCKPSNNEKSNQDDNQIRNTIVPENRSGFEDVTEREAYSHGRPILEVTPEQRDDQTSSNDAAEDTLSMLETQSFSERNHVHEVVAGKERDVKSDSDEDSEFCALALLETQALLAECSRVDKEPPCSINRDLHKKFVENKKTSDVGSGETKRRKVEENIDIQIKATLLPSNNDKPADIEQNNEETFADKTDIHIESTDICVPKNTETDASALQSVQNTGSLVTTTDNSMTRVTVCINDQSVAGTSDLDCVSKCSNDVTPLTTKLLINHDALDSASPITRIETKNAKRDHMVGGSLSTASDIQAQDPFVGEIKLLVDDVSLQIQRSTSKKNANTVCDNAAGIDQCKTPNTKSLFPLARNNTTEKISNFSQPDEHGTYNSDFMATQVYAVAEVAAQSTGSMVSSHTVADTKAHNPVETDPAPANSEHHTACGKFVQSQVSTLKAKRQIPAPAVTEPCDVIDPRDLMPTQLYSTSNVTTDSDVTNTPIYLTATDCASSSKYPFKLSDSEIVDEGVISDDDIFSTAVENSEPVAEEYNSLATQPFKENTSQSNASVANAPDSLHRDCIPAPLQTSRCGDSSPTKEGGDMVNNTREERMTSAVRCLRKRRMPSRYLSTNDNDVNKSKKKKIVEAESTSPTGQVPKKRKVRRSPKIQKVLTNSTENLSPTCSSREMSTSKVEKPDGRTISLPQSHKANTNPTNKQPKTKVTRSKAKTSRKDNVSVFEPSTALTEALSTNSASTIKSKITTPSTARKSSQVDSFPSTVVENNAATEGDDAALVSLRPRKCKPKVMFTGVVDKIGEKMVKNLGGHMTDDVFECTHLITDKIRRTVKFLCAVARGIHILNQEWLRESQHHKRFLSEEDFELNNASLSQASSYSADETNLEELFDFNLATTLSLARSRPSPLMENIRIHVTKSVLPPPEQMYQIVSCAGGECVRKIPRGEKLKSVIVVSAEKDKRSCASAIKANIPIVSKEYILTGILRQKLEVENFQLFEAATPDKNNSNTKCRKNGVKKTNATSNALIAEESVCDSSSANRRSLRKRKAR